MRNTALVTSALLLSVAGLASGCSSSEKETPQERGRSAATVAVESRDIHSVVVLQGSVVSEPQFAVSAPKLGRFAPSVEVGSVVKAGDSLGTVAGVSVSSPVAGAVTDVARPGQVPPGLPVVTLEYGGFGISAPVTDELSPRLYGQQLGAKASLMYGASGFECSLVDSVSDPEASSESPTGGTSLCLVPLKYRAHPGMRADVGIDMGKRDDVLALPLTAVSGAAQEGTVALLTGDDAKERQVSLGVSDGTFIEIVDGLESGDRVLLNAPLF